jgi:hypothetical protein
MRILVAIMMALLARAVDAAEVGDLYEARAFVTGQGEATRAVGFARALEEVLVKVSGDPRLVGDARVAALAPQAGAMVASFRYRDRLEGIPTHDEQGTRDRPYELTVRFDPARIDATLRDLGRRPWGSDRPWVLVMMHVRLPTGTIALTSDGARGRDQRDALVEAAARRGVPILLWNTRIFMGILWCSVSRPAQGHAARPCAATAAVAVDAHLSGTLAWSDAALGWTGEWQLYAGGRTHRWRISGVSFDDAFRNAMGGAAQILSGNGAPQ